MKPAVQARIVVALLIITLGAHPFDPRFEFRRYRHSEGQHNNRIPSPTQ